MLEMKNVSFAYGAENVLEKINFKLEFGDFWAVIGPNGGGKTTFVKLLLGLLKPNKGEISYTSNIQPCHIGNVPQMTYNNIQFPICVRDTIALGLLQPRIFGFNPKKSQDSIFQAMELLEITHLAKKPLYALSGGERQKVLIARAIVNNPQILILDEPTANIDSKAQKSIYELLKKLNRTMSIVVVSHDLSLTLGYAKKVLYVNKNAVIHEIPDFKLDVSGHICEVDLLTHFAMQPNNSSLGNHCVDFVDSKNAESNADSTIAKVAKHDFASIKMNGGNSQSEMPTLKASSGWGIFKGEGATSQFKPLPLKEKNKNQTKPFYGLPRLAPPLCEKTKIESKIENPLFCENESHNISNKDISPMAQYDKDLKSQAVSNYVDENLESKTNLIISAVAKHDFAINNINSGNSQANLRNLSPQKAMDNLKDLKL